MYISIDNNDKHNGSPIKNHWKGVLLVISLVSLHKKVNPINYSVKNICGLEEYAMRINCTIEFSMVLDGDKFYKLLIKASDKNSHMEENGEESIDRSLAQKGVTAIYRDSQYKKKVRILADLGMVLKDGHDTEQSIRKLDKRIIEYFGFRYKLDDCTISGLMLTADIDVGNHEKVAAYLKVLRRIGKIKGFSLSDYDCFEEGESFCLDGNSNGIRFRIYDLESLLKRQLQRIDMGKKKVKSVAREAQGILRAEVQLTKQKAVRVYADASDVSGQIAELSIKCQDIFMDTFAHIIPFGDFYKMDKAVEIVRKEVTDTVLRRKMLRLLTLIPEKKSLYLAQMAMSCRNIEKVMDMFAKSNCSASPMKR